MVEFVSKSVIFSLTVESKAENVLLYRPSGLPESFLGYTAGGDTLSGASGRRWRQEEVRVRVRLASVVLAVVYVGVGR